jgi:hypothetical protein
MLGNVLIELRFRNGVALREPLSLALLFLENDYSYRTYDSKPIHADTKWRREDAQIANRIGARMSAGQIDALMTRKQPIESALRRIPGSSSLAEQAEAVPWDAIHDLFQAVSGISGVGLAKATKALHKKRPHLIPMLDSFVGGYLRSVDQISVGSFADVALSLTRSYKVDLDANAETLESVQHDLNDRGYTLSLCRILDLYTWAYAGDKPPPWAAQVEKRMISYPSEQAMRPVVVEDAIDEGAELAGDLGIDLDEDSIGLRILRAAAREVGYVQARHEIKRWLRP